MTAQLKSAREIYPDIDEDDHYPFYDYSPILDSFGKIIIQEHEHSYQGDSWLIYEFAPGTYGYLCFGWGSCAGCDALQASKTYADVDDLIKSLFDSIRMFSKEELIEYFSNKEVLESCYAWAAQDFQEFLTQVGKYFDFIPPEIELEKEYDYKDED